MKQVGRLIGVAAFALLMAACDKCGGLALGVWANPASAVCTGDKPQG